MTTSKRTPLTICPPAVSHDSLERLVVHVLVGLIRHVVVRWYALVLPIHVFLC